MALYAIADVHLSLGADKPMDVFPGWEDYTRRLQEKLAPSGQTGRYGGDRGGYLVGHAFGRYPGGFCVFTRIAGQKTAAHAALDCWTTRRKMERYLETEGFTDITFVHNSAVPVQGCAVCGTRGWLAGAMSEEDQKIVNREVGRLKTSLDEALRQDLSPLVFLHYPPIYDGARCQPILDLLREYEITDCYYGHIHGKQAAQRAPMGEYEGIRMHLLSCDYVRFLPQRIF